MYNPANYKDWKDAAAQLVKDEVVLPDGWDHFSHMKLKIEYGCKRPKTTKLDCPKPDIDNYEKSLYDAISDSGLIWHDDRQVVEVHQRKVWADSDYIRFIIEPIEFTDLYLQGWWEGPHQ